MKLFFVILCRPRMYHRTDFKFTLYLSIVGALILFRSIYSKDTRLCDVCTNQYTDNEKVTVAVNFLRTSVTRTFA